MKKERSFAQIFSKYGVLMVFIVMFIMFSIFAPNFLRVKNLLNVSRQICTLGICAVGTTIVLISGGIDLSLGYQLSVTNVLCAYLMVKMGMHPVLAILVCLVFGVTVGAINGIIIVKSGVHSMIVTLAISQVLNGVSYLLAADTPDEEAEGSCYILKDMSGREETEALYEFVEDEDELEGLMKIFDELLEDVDIERE